MSKASPKGGGALARAQVLNTRLAAGPPLTMRRIGMIIHVVGNPDITGLKRALDRFLLLMVEQDVTEVRNLYISAEVRRGDAQVACVDEAGRPHPVYIERYPNSHYWEASANVAPGVFAATEESGPTWRSL